MAPLLHAVLQTMQHTDTRKTCFFEKIAQEKTVIQFSDTLYVTLEPCSERTSGGGGERYGDCATKIINSPVKHVVFAAVYPHDPSETNARFTNAGISVRQYKDPKIIEEARRIFNEVMIDKEYIRKKGNKSFI